MKCFVLLLAAVVPFGALAETISFSPEADIQLKVQEALILAEPGTTFEFAEGVYEFNMGLSLDVDDVTIRGAGMDKTIFSFKAQDAGAEGLFVTSDNVTLEDFAIEDTKGNCFKSNGVENLVLRRVRTEWTGGPKESNGAYGLYPVSSKNVLIDGCVAIGASDAGIYVGQTKNVIVRNSRAEYNVAGIEIENCHSADVYNNVATNNTGGLLVFDLPGLPMQKGRDVRVFQNKIYNNDTANFAPAGNIVAKVPQGTGVLIMSNSNVHVYENDIRDHRSYNVLISSYLSTGEELKDPEYYPYPEGIYIHSNTFGKAGWAPAGELGEMAAVLTGGTLPDIVWDGITNPEKLKDGALPAEARIYISNNTKDEGELTFANLDAGAMLQAKGAEPRTPVVSRDLSAHEGSLPPLKPVDLSGLE
jgi:parallel beta-helix repeat protein